MLGRWLSGAGIKEASIFFQQIDGRYVSSKFIIIGITKVSFLVASQVFDPEKNYGKYTIA